MPRRRLHGRGGLSYPCIDLFAFSFSLSRIRGVFCVSQRFLLFSRVKGLVRKYCSRKLFSWFSGTVVRSINQSTLCTKKAWKLKRSMQKRYGICRIVEVCKIRQDCCTVWMWIRRAYSSLLGPKSQGVTQTGTETLEHPVSRIGIILSD